MCIKNGQKYQKNIQMKISGLFFGGDIFRVKIREKYQSVQYVAAVGEPVEIWRGFASINRY